MAIVEMVMPRMGESVMECTVIGILKKVGDRVEADDSVMEVATDKVDTEVPTPYGGVIAEILVKEGDVVPVGNAIIRIETNGSVAVPVAEESKEVQTLEKEIETVTQSLVANLQPSSPTHTTSEAVGTRFYSPLVQTIAKMEGVSLQELEKIAGTGAENRVTKKDILDYLASRSSKSIVDSQQSMVDSQQANPKQETANPKHETSKGIEVVPMDRMRKLIAERMVESKRISPHVSSFVETDMTNIVLWRNQIKDEFKRQTGEGLTFTPLLIEAVVKAIKDFPLINISVEGDSILKKRDINVGMAVALPSGNLIVPVIHNADQYSLIGLAKKVNDLANRARQNKLTADDLAGGTYTVSNIGTFGNIMGTPIILQPQVAIMAFGAIQKRPVVIETPQGDVIGIRSMMYISHSYDHRVVDGALGGMFVKRVSDYLSEFDLNRKLF
ncbi:2-oxoglutarate dehydrogenase E2 component (dihydrolipoamide succinyltransferase) [Runella defluvii]|uniref:Dihydrolipoamide acetyltransferase component of pyruvate dehydrogenase complex n=1 Tax=Runella defluvii TaxID=370973 RepID=A0A7W5ZR15_9BACT|nr:dihydrolipoamide acetyltransferase family protein [Runella defluvii]MBB3840057.1 2-oxoglutarate dehydrogenase E2 component (dihydrolipoamide succinyltransferase) [Runella defluvii]